MVDMLWFMYHRLIAKKNPINDWSLAMNVAGACCMCIDRSVVCHAVFLGLRALSIRPCFFLFLWFSVHVSACEHGVAKIASHAIFQYIVLIINDTHNTWTNIIVKMIILRFLGSSDDKEKIGKVRSVALEEPTPWYFGAEGNRSQVSL